MRLRAGDICLIRHTCPGHPSLHAGTRVIAVHYEYGRGPTRIWVFTVGTTGHYFSLRVSTVITPEQQAIDALVS